MTSYLDPKTEGLVQSYIEKGLPVSYVPNALGEMVPKVDPAAWNIHTGQPASGLTGVKHRTGSPTVDDIEDPTLTEQWLAGDITLQELQTGFVESGNGDGNGNGNGNGNGGSFDISTLLKGGIGTAALLVGLLYLLKDR